MKSHLVLGLTSKICFHKISYDKVERVSNSVEYSVNEMLVYNWVRLYLVVSVSLLF